MYKRSPNDFYPSPPWCGEALVSTVPQIRDGLIWEPAAGEGDLARGFGCDVLQSDLIRGLVPLDFLSVDRLPPGVKTIATNPPYGKLATRFVEHAFLLAPERCAFLMRWAWAGEISRLPYWRHMEHVILLGRVGMLPPGAEDKGHTPMTAYAWFVMNPGRESCPNFSSWTPLTPV